MRTNGATAGRALGAALLLGVTGDLVFYQAPGLGLNAALWSSGTVLGWSVLRREAGAPPAGAERNLLLAVLAIAVGMVWRSSEMLLFLDAVALLVIAAILPFAARPELGVALGRIMPGQLLRGVGWMAQTGLAGLAPCVLDANRQVQGSGGRLPVGAVLRGLLLAIPTLLIFGGLLGKADPVFGRVLQDLLRLDFQRLMTHTVTILAFSWLAAGLLVRAVARKEPLAALTPVAAGRGLGAVELVILLGSVDLLFLAFVGFQLPYFFGDQAFVLRWSGGTLADYARRGFFELVALSAMVLPLLLAVHARLVQDVALVQRLYRGLATGQVALLLVIIASAMHRMALYQGAFGLTEDRFFASALIAGLAVTSAWFALTMLRRPSAAGGGPARFISGSLVAWGVWLALLHVVNPDRVIAETNLRRAASGLTLDVRHLGGLSADAVPAIAAAWPSLPAADRAALRVRLGHRLRLEDDDWRNWNLSRSRARSLLSDLNQP